MHAELWEENILNLKLPSWSLQATVVHTNPLNTSRYLPPRGSVPLNGSSVDVFKFFLEKSLMLHDKDIALWLPPRDSWIFWGQGGTEGTQNINIGLTWLYWNKFKVLTVFMWMTKLQPLPSSLFVSFMHPWSFPFLYFVLFCSVFLSKCLYRFLKDIEIQHLVSLQQGVVKI